MARPQKMKPDEVLDRAMDLFWRKGCDAVTTRDLEAALDLRAPAIYRRFSTKDDLLAQCIHHYINTVVAKRIRQRLEHAESPIAGLHSFFVSALAPHGQEPVPRGCMLTQVAGHRAMDHPAVRTAQRRGLETVRASFELQIERAKTLGELGAQTDARALSQTLFVTLQGVMTLARLGTRDLEAGISATFALLGLRVPSAQDASTDQGRR